MRAFGGGLRRRSGGSDDKRSPPCVGCAFVARHRLTTHVLPVALSRWIANQGVLWSSQKLPFRGLSCAAAHVAALPEISHELSSFRFFCSLWIWLCVGSFRRIHLFSKKIYQKERERAGERERERPEPRKRVLMCGGVLERKRLLCYFYELRIRFQCPILHNTAQRRW